MYHWLFHINHLWLPLFFPSYNVFILFPASLHLCIGFFYSGFYLTLVAWQWTCISCERWNVGTPFPKLLWHYNMTNFWSVTYSASLNLGLAFIPIEIAPKIKMYIRFHKFLMVDFLPVYSETSDRELLWNCNQQERMLCTAAMCWMLSRRAQRSTGSWDNSTCATPGGKPLWVCWTKPEQLF